MPKSSIFSYLLGIKETIRTDYAVKIYAREVICFYSYFSVNGVDLYNILD